MTPVSSATSTTLGMSITNRVAAAIDATSAPMLNVFATRVSPSAKYRIGRAKRSRISAARPFPVANPSRAAVSCTAAAMGATAIVDQSKLRPNAAPTCE